MKVLLINGSPHKEGCTYTALCEVSDALVREGIGTDLFWIGIKPLSGCIACKACVEKHKCVFDDTVNEFLDIADNYDGFIFGTPVHWSAASGALTSFILLKPAATVISTRRAGTTATWDQLNKYFGLMQMPIISSRYWNMVHGTSPKEVKKDLEGMQIMRILGKNMSWFLKCKEAGQQAGISLPDQEKVTYTNFIRH